MTKEGRALLNEIKARIASNKLITAVLKKEALKLDMKFISALSTAHILEWNCECCGRPVKVPVNIPGYETPDLEKTICPFCSRPLQLNIPMPKMVQ